MRLTHPLQVYFDEPLLQPLSLRLQRMRCAPRREDLVTLSRQVNGYTLALLRPGSPWTNVVLGEVSDLVAFFPTRLVGLVAVAQELVG
jgi:hypothetical protein